MNKYNPDIHNRHSIRLRGYDYSQKGLYSITICTHERQMLFGNIIDGEMHLNELGNIAENEWFETPKHRPYVVLHGFVVMPNHIHGIIEITKCRGVACNAHMGNDNAHDGIRKQGVARNEGVARNAPTGGTHADNIMSDISPKPATLSTIIRAYKSAVSKSIHTCRGVARNAPTDATQTYNPHIVWQRNYHERIIRNDENYRRISEYIQSNPLKWKEDCFYIEVNS